MTEFTFTVPGPPVPKGRPRMTRRGRVYTPQKTLDYENKVLVAALQARCPRFTGPVSIELQVYLPTRRRSDLDNYIKVIDGLQPTIIPDDSLVIHIVAEKFYDKECPRMVVCIRGHSGNGLFT